ncbi:MAG: methyltransferase domain-containing protein [Ginsengibacter sp.]
MKNNYDRIAWCYDLLSNIVFGNRIKKAQTEILNFIPPGSRILIAGGGTGWILEKIAKVYLSGLSITYIDASAKMIQKSKRRDIASNKVKFMCIPIEQVKLPDENFDVLITSFFFDNFSESASRLIFQQLHSALKKDGIWLFTDFRLSKTERYWQKPMINLMYFFFRAVCQLQARQLPDTENIFSNNRYKKIFRKMFYKHFIISIVFKKEPG